MNKIFLSILMILLLAACSATSSSDFKPQSTVRVITSMSYPEFPDLEPLSDVNIIPWAHDMPRDMTILSVKNISDCRKVKTHNSEEKPYVVLPVEDQSVQWWQKCGENPILPNSNIFIGFSQENWNIILEDFAKLRERNWQYKQRIMEINHQRQEWRKKAEEERIRLEKIQNDTQDKSQENPPKISEKNPVINTLTYLPSN